MTLADRLRTVRRPGGYDPGDHLDLTVKDARGETHPVAFEIAAYCGGGFAGQVYRARVVSSAAPTLREGDEVALKVFRTRSGLRRRFRDFLYWLGFQSPFPHQYNEDAVREGLPLTRLLQAACARVFGTAKPINECYGTFWDDHVRSFGEVNEWVDGVVTDPERDDGILLRWLHNRRVRRTGEGTFRHCPLEIAKKHACMDRLVKLCRELGLDDLARQAYWWTGMSQANLLTRTETHGTPQPSFVWVDRRPGLPGFILSLGDLVLFWQAVWRWSVPPFDRVNTAKLRAWFTRRGEAGCQADLDELEELDARYRRSQLDLFGHHVHLLTDKALRAQIAKARVEYWYLSGRIDAQAKERFLNSKARFLGSFLASLVPVVGRLIQRLLSNREWRTHVTRLLRDPAYRRQQWDDRRAENLKAWLADGRTTPVRAEAVYRSFPRYFWDLACSVFPPSWQLFLTDPAVRWNRLKRMVVSPVKYVFGGSYRRQVNRDWVRRRTHEDLERGFLDEETAEAFIRISGDRAMQEYLTGILATAAVKPTSEICYVLFWAWVVTQVQKLKTMGWELAPLVALVMLVSPAGTLRLTYCLLRLPFRHGVPYGTATLLAAFRGVGDMAFFVQIAKTYPAFSGYILTATVCRLAENFPVFGERGGLLSIWTVTVLLSWPASVRRWREERRRQGRRRLK